MTQTAGDAARAAYEAGLCVVPPRQDGSKRPEGRWQEYQRRRPTLEQIESWYAVDRTGVGLVCGTVSGGLEMIEFERRAVEEGINAAFLAAAEAAGYGELLERITAGYIEWTPGGGLHLLYRCPQVGGNTKLARRPATAEELKENPDEGVKVLIETRGEGGFVITAPSCGSVHPTGAAWELINGGFGHIATITPEERADLFALARAFDDPGEDDEAEQMVSTSVAALLEDDSRRPGDDYNARTTWGDVLGPHGWTPVFERNGIGYWRRPGKKQGISATTNAKGTDRLIVFSSSTPFDSDSRGGRMPSYDRFGAYAVLEHRGDRAAAARALRQHGYGGDTRSHEDLTSAPWLQKSTNAVAVRQDVTTTSQNTTNATVRPFRRIPLDLDAPPVDVPVLAGMLYDGLLTVLQSEPGVGKSWVAAWLAGQLVECGFTAIYIDEEGGPELITERLRSLGVDPAAVAERFHYYAFESRRWEQADLEALDAVIAEATVRGRCAVAVLDSLPDFLAAAGWSEDSAQDVTTFVNHVLRRFRNAGIAHLLLDHLVKPPTDTKNKRSRYSRGSGAKLAKSDATLLLEVVEEFDAHTSGLLQLWKTKDRRGRLALPPLTKPGLPIAVTVSDGKVEMEVRQDAVQVEPWDGPTHCMDAVLETLRVAGGPVPQRTLADQMRGLGHNFRNETIRESAERLALEGRVSVSTGPRRSRLYTWRDPADGIERPLQ